MLFLPMPGLGPYAAAPVMIALGPVASSVLVNKGRPPFWTVVLNHKTRPVEG